MIYIYISRVVNWTNLSESTKQQALYIMNEVTEREMSVRKDPWDAATIIYISCLKTGEQRFQT
jgi:transcription initiation factor TFIIIB Brf1 subunit/transcription initiation factor TFIIB